MSTSTVTGRSILFADREDGPRARRASDVFKLAGALAVLALIVSAAAPPAGFEQALARFLAAVPSALDGIWQVALDLLALWALVIIAAAAIRRRGYLLASLGLAVALGLLGAAVAARVVDDAWPSLWDGLRTNGPPPSFSPFRLSASAALVITATPHLSRTARQLGRWLVAFGVLGAALLGATAPTGALGALLIAVAAAAVVHLALGSPRGWPSLADVQTALAGLGIDATGLSAADRQPAGVFLVHGDDGSGRPLTVKVYGRDAADTQLLSSLWRTVWYRDAGAPWVPTRLQQVEHEAFLTLLARQHGVTTTEVVTAARTADDDALLVLRTRGGPLAAEPTPWGEETARQVWDLVDRLHRAGIAHNQIDAHHLVRDGDGVALIDFRAGVTAPDESEWHTDQVQVLITTVLASGVDVALAAARQALGADGLRDVLPYVQMAALTSHQRREVRERHLDLDDLRTAGAAAADIEAPKLAKLRRVSWGSLVRVGLLAVAAMVLGSAASGMDWQELADQLGEAVWWLVVAAFIVAQLPRVAQAVSTLGASPVPLPLGPVYALQLAVSYVNLAVPTSAARIAVNVRFFQRHGVPAGSALAVGALDGFSGFIVQAGLLAGILLFTPASLELDLSGRIGSGSGDLILIIVVFAVAAFGVVFAVPKLRHAVTTFVRQMVREAFSVLRGLRSPRRLGLLFGGNLASEILFAVALGAFARALGTSIGLGELILINVSVALLAGLMPIPGGIGVSEGGLTFGLVRAGMPEEAAFAAVLLYRLATFYLPPIWGFVSFRWLERNQHL